MFFIYTLNVNAEIPYTVIGNRTTYGEAIAMIREQRANYKGKKLQFGWVKELNQIPAPFMFGMRGRYDRVTEEMIPALLKEHFEDCDA